MSSPRASLLAVSLTVLVLTLPAAAGAASGPTADFTCAPSCSVLTGTTVTFSATTNAGKPQESWDLDGDGTYGDATGATASAAFTKPGDDKVSLQVVDDADKQTTTVTHDVIVAAPTLSVACAPSCTVDAGTAVTFTASSNAAQPAYAWDLQGRVPPSFVDATGPAATETFQSPGTFTVTVQMTDAVSGNRLTTAVAVTVNDSTAAQVQRELLLADSPIGHLILGPEHDQPAAPSGPSQPTIPAGARPPRLTLTTPKRPVHVGGLVSVSLKAKGTGRETVSWDLDGDGVRNDAYGTHVTYPITCPGATEFRAEAVDQTGLHAGDEVRVRAVGSASPRGLSAVMGHAPTGRGSLGFKASYGGWRHIGTAFGARPQANSMVPVERTLRTDGSVGGDYANVKVPASSAKGGLATSWRTARGVRGLTPDAAGETATGSLVSPRFVLRHALVDFQIGGRNASCHGQPQETAALYVLRHGSFVKVPGTTQTPGEQDEMRTVTLHVPRGLMGATVEMVAQDNSAAGHIDIGGVTNTGKAGHAMPTPVLGWADTHEHLDAHQGFGGLDGIRTYMGVPGGTYTQYEPAFSPSATARQRIAAATAYATDLRDNPTHFAGPLGSLIMQLAHGLLAGSSLVQAFHEQFQVVELHRDWEGGMRLISSLAVSNEALEYLVGYPQSNGNVTLAGDRAVILAHVVAMRELAADNSSWMQIVYSPTQAHDAIAAGKLAVVLGTEVDQLGSLGFASPEDEVDWLWRLGVRQVTPIHSVNNALGGAAIFQDVYDMANDLINRHNPAGNSTTQSTTDEIYNGIQSHGIEATTRVAGNTNASYGFFFHATTANNCLGTGAFDDINCVGYTLNPVQMSIGMGNFAALGGRTPLVVGSNVTNGSGDLPFILATAHSTPGPPTGGLNVQGLTPLGKRYIDDLERHGMLIDMEHMSDASVNDLIAPSPAGTPQAQRSPAWQYDPDGGCSGLGPHPVNAAGHQVSIATCYANAYPFMSSHTSFRNQSLNYGQTQQKGFLRREFERTDAQIDYIDRAGGTVAPVTLQDPVNATDTHDPSTFHIQSATNPSQSGLNDCAGSSKSWVEAYLWAINHTDNHHIALSTDMALVGGTGPRFNRPAVAGQGPTLPGNCPASSGNETAGLNLSIGGASDYLFHPDDITRDLRAGEVQDEHDDPGQYNHDGQTHPIAYANGPVTGASMHIDQPPAGGSRNFNLDGMTTIGQLPDLLQDAINDGMDARDMAPLMNSAQYYLDMWDKAYQLNGCLDRYDQPTASDGIHCQGATPTNSGLNIASVCRNTCPNDPGDGSSLDSAGHSFAYTTEVALVG